MGYQQRMRTKAGASFNGTPAGDSNEGQIPDTDAVYAKYWTVIPHLVAGKSMIATAQACGINVRTLRRWMETPEFKQEYSLTKREHFDIVANRLTAYADKEALIEELETEVAELHETSETLVQLKSKLSAGNFARPEWFPEPNWNKITKDNRHLDSAA